MGFRKLPRALFLFFIFQYLASISCLQSADPTTHVKPQQELFQQAQDYKYGQNNKPVDMQKAITLLQEAANSGNDEAMYSLGEIYEYGLGDIPQNLEVAVKYFNSSAQLGNADAHYSLGFLFETGKIDNENNKASNAPMALLHYAFAAQGASPQALLTLGYKHLYGHHVAKNCGKAQHRYQQVAEMVVRGMKESSIMLGGSGGLQQELVRLADQEAASRDRHKEEEDIVQYYHYSADTGDPTAQVTMGLLFLQGGFGVPQNVDEAFRYFERAAVQGDPAGLSHLGFMYANGYSVEQNNATAIDYYKQAAEKGHPQALTNLGYMYMHGYGVKKSVAEAVKLFKAAADQGHPEGQLNLGTLLYSGDGVKQDYSKAIAYFTLSAQQGNLVALYNLAQMHEYGLGTPVSCITAVQYYKKVAERGTWLSFVHEAYKLYQRGDYVDSLYRYEKAAHQGYEAAQSNAAYMYDKGIGLAHSQHLQKEEEGETSTPASFEQEEQEHKATTVNNNASLRLRYERALRYYQMSSEQKNALSHLRLGDYYYYGLGTNVSMERAAMFYQAASDLGNPQAMFNLGYMHQNGLGLPQDLHLAKRYYDMSLQSDRDGYLAVNLALLHLGVNFIAEWYRTGTLFTTLPTEWWGLQWDTALILILVLILVVCVIIKHLTTR